VMAHVLVFVVVIAFVAVILIGLLTMD